MATKSDSRDSLIARFERAVLLRPAAVAVRGPDGAFTYGELQRRAKQIAAACIAAAGPGRPVVVCCERSAAAVAGIVGAAYAGSPFVPMDTDEPAARLAQILRIANPGVAIVDSTGAERFSELGIPMVDVSPSKQDPAAFAATPLDLAYILFTSGSTGVPKGVEVPEASLVSFLVGARSWAALTPTDVVASFHSFTFDISMWEVWGALTHGSTLVVLPRISQVDPQRLVHELHANGVTRLCQTPTAIRQLCNSMGVVPASIKSIFICGEKLDFAILEPLVPSVRSGQVALFNLYGPTEATIYATGYRISATDIEREPRSLIGSSLPHVATALIANGRQVFTPGDEGEILLSGPGVARGYRQNPEETARRFVGDGPRRSFATGDIARLVEHNGLEFLGRSGGWSSVRSLSPHGRRRSWVRRPQSSWRMMAARSLSSL